MRWRWPGQESPAAAVEDDPAPEGAVDHSFVSTDLSYAYEDPSPAGNFPEWDKGHAGTKATAGKEGTNCEDQGETSVIFDAWGKWETGGGKEGKQGKQGDLVSSTSCRLLCKNLSLAWLLLK